MQKPKQAKQATKQVEEETQTYITSRGGSNCESGRKWVANPGSDLIHVIRKLERTREKRRKGAEIC
jgi:hypothetical protein